MNGFYILLFLLIIGIFGGIFYMTQKDAVVSDIFAPAPTNALPTGGEVLQVISRTPPVQSQTDSAPQQIMPTFGVEGGTKASYSAAIITTAGEIKINLDGTNAPKTVLNFLNKAKSGYYKNLTFHRVEDWVIQGGDPKGDGSGGNLVQTELNAIPFSQGSLGMAGIKNQQGEIISNDSQFFITKSEAAWLNGQYTNFGAVTAGMDVVNKIKIGDKILKITVD